MHPMTMGQNSAQSGIWLFTCLQQSLSGDMSPMSAMSPMEAMGASAIGLAAA